MTNEESIKILEAYRDKLTNSVSNQLDGDIEVFSLAIKALETIPKYKDAYNKGWDDGAKATYEHLKMCEEEQEPKTGHWIIYDVHGHKACKCSECGKDAGYPCNDKYCRHCGARIVESQERSGEE